MAGSMTERSGEGWNGYITGMAPVQRCGRVDGYPWYFRARWSAWSFEIAEDRGLDEKDFPDVGDVVPGWAAWERWGTWPDASAMSADTAWSIVETCIERFRSGQLQYLFPGGPRLPTP